MSPFLLAEQLLKLQPESSLPRDLPGRYGRTIVDLERLLMGVEARGVVAGGWAVWHHGYAGRVTQDVDVVVAESGLEEIQRVAGFFGFQVLELPQGSWPKLVHKSTGIEVDIWPQGGIPGTEKRPAPVAIGHPDVYGADSLTLRYITLAGLVELKLGASRAKDIADLIELIKTHPNDLSSIRAHLATVHATYVQRFEELIEQASEEGKEQRAKSKERRELPLSAPCSPPSALRPHTRY